MSFDVACNYENCIAVFPPDFNERSMQACIAYSFVILIQFKLPFDDVNFHHINN